MSVKVLVKRDSVANFTTESFIPREYEFISAYDEESGRIVYKIGDGKTAWVDLPEVTTIDEIDRFKVYFTSGKEAMQMFLKPQSIQAYLDEGDINESRKSNTQM